MSEVSRTSQKDSTWHVENENDKEARRRRANNQQASRGRTTDLLQLATVIATITVCETQTVEKLLLYHVAYEEIHPLHRGSCPLLAWLGGGSTRSTQHSFGSWYVVRRNVMTSVLLSETPRWGPGHYESFSHVLNRSFCLFYIEFDRLLQKHASETGLPVVVDFYSDSCGPCRMMAPIFKKVAAEYKDTAVFVKVDTNAQYELSSRYQVRSLPTFMYFVNGKKANQAVGGIGEQGLRQQTDQVVRQAEIENTKLTVDVLETYYQQVDPSKSKQDIASVHKKCVDMTKGVNECVGTAANQLTRRLKQKYKQGPKLQPRFTAEDRQAKTSKETPKDEKTKRGTSGGRSDKANLHLASKEDLQKELERRLDEERDAQVEDEDENEEEADPELSRRWTPGSFPERMVIIGGGPAGMAAAIYGARAGLEPLVIAPSMGGQLQGKGVDVENYPGLMNMTGPGVIASMRRQAAHFGALFEDDVVVSIDATQRPLQVVTNSTGKIATHTVVVATGAEANWLQVPGEWQLRGGGVSSCATCDGFLFSGKHVIVVGGGDAAMEDALVLARTSKSVTVIHRRDQFRASKVLADRVLNHPLISVKWNQVVKEIVGKPAEQTEDSEEENQVVSHVILEDVVSGETSRLDCEAVFVAIGHTPSTSFLEGVVEFDPQHPGYLKTEGTSTQTSVAGIFAAGDVADSVYRQAITSAGSGAAAALDAERYLSENGLGNEEAEMEAELLAELADDLPSGAAYNAYEEAGGRMEGMKESVASEL